MILNNDIFGLLCMVNEKNSMVMVNSFWKYFSITYLFSW